VNHLEYEKEKTNKEIELDGESAKTKENDNFTGHTEDSKKSKSHLKKLYEENEDANIHTVFVVILICRSARRRRMTRRR
jgi:hypothetical protein